MTDDYWGPEDDGEADRLRALLRRWVKGEEGYAPTWYSVYLGGSYTCERCFDIGESPEDIDHNTGCVVAETLKELGE